MNCIKDGKYTGDSCFGCKVKIEDCEIRDKVYRNRWIPVSEILPEKTERVLVTLKNECVCECFWISNTFKQIDGWKMTEFSSYNPVIAWQSLPSPYKEPR